MAHFLNHAVEMPTNANYLLRTQDGARVRRGVIIDINERPIDEEMPRMQRLTRTQAYNEWMLQTWQLVYVEEPTNDQLYMFGQLPFSNGGRFVPFAQRFPHLVRYTGDNCDNIVIVEESREGVLTVLQVDPETAVRPVHGPVRRW